MPVSSLIVFQPRPEADAGAEARSAAGIEVGVTGRGLDSHDVGVAVGVQVTNGGDLVGPSGTHFAGSSALLARRARGDGRGYQSSRPSTNPCTATPAGSPRRSRRACGRC